MSNPEDPMSPTGGPGAPTGPQAYAAAPAPPEQRGIGALVATIVVMLLLGGAIGYVAAPSVLGDDEDDAEVASEESTDTTTTAPAADPTVWADPYGTFQVAFPEGWSVGADKYGAGQFALSARPGAVDDDLYDAGGATATFDRRPDLTTEGVLDELSPSERCATDGGREPFSQGELTGVVQTYLECPNGFELRRVAVAVPGGTNLLMVSVSQPGDDAALTRGLESFVAGADPATQVAPFAGCPDNAPGTDPEYPLAVQIKNHLDETISIGWVDPTTDEVPEPTEVEAAFVTGSFYAKTGDVYRATWAGGTVDYTATAEPLQCVVFNEDGFVPVPG
jgi:hypothetical protein